MFYIKSFLFSCLVAATIISPSSANLAIGSFSEAATAREMFEFVDSRIRELMDKAVANADYVLAGALSDARSALTAWEEANKSILDDAAEKIDSATRDALIGINDSIDRVDRGVTDTLEAASEISDQANQVVESLPTNHRSYVIRYIPRVIPPTAADSFQVRIRGVNLQRANPRLIVEGQEVRRAQPSNLEAEYTVPMDAFEPDRRLMKIETVSLTYLSDPDGFFQRLFGGKELLEREINLVHLPVEVARVRVAVQREYERRENDLYSNPLGQFEGRNQRVYKVARPPQGWRWDLSQPHSVFVTSQGTGVQGTCEGVEWNNSTEEGLRYRARVEERGTFDQNPGYVNCTIAGPIYRMVTINESYNVQADDSDQWVLTWTEDLRIPLPEHSENVTLTFETFDQRTRIIENTGSDKYFKVQRSEDSVLVVPTVPRDMIQ